MILKDKKGYGDILLALTVVAITGLLFQSVSHSFLSSTNLQTNNRAKIGKEFYASELIVLHADKLLEVNPGDLCPPEQKDSDGYCKTNTQTNSNSPYLLKGVPGMRFWRQEQNDKVEVCGGVEKSKVCFSY